MNATLKRTLALRASTPVTVVTDKRAQFERHLAQRAADAAALLQLKGN